VVLHDYLTDSLLRPEIGLHRQDEVFRWFRQAAIAAMEFSIAQRPQTWEIVRLIYN
jgi:hypothetical protein